MCLAVPAEVIALKGGGMATVRLGGIAKDISLALIEDVAPGDFVVVHVGFALGKIDRHEAERTLALLAEVAA